MSKPVVKFGARDLRVSKHPFGVVSGRATYRFRSAPVTLTACLRHAKKRGPSLLPQAPVVSGPRRPCPKLEGQPARSGPGVISCVVLRVAPDLAGLQHGEHRPQEVVRRGDQRNLFPSRVVTADALVERANVR